MQQFQVKQDDTGALQKMENFDITASVICDLCGRGRELLPERRLGWYQRELSGAGTEDICPTCLKNKAPELLEIAKTQARQLVNEHFWAGVIRLESTVRMSIPREVTRLKRQHEVIAQAAMASADNGSIDVRTKSWILNRMKKAHDKLDVAIGGNYDGRQKDITAEVVGDQKVSDVPEENS